MVECLMHLASVPDGRRPGHCNSNSSERSIVVSRHLSVRHASATHWPDRNLVHGPETTSAGHAAKSLAEEKVRPHQPAFPLRLCGFSSPSTTFGLSAVRARSAPPRSETGLRSECGPETLVCGAHHLIFARGGSHFTDLSPRVPTEPRY